MIIRLTVHPRVCGEQRVAQQLSVACSGSSPRVRGTVLPDGQELLAVRFIPACAGNRQFDGASSLSRSVHPRVCGEQPPTRRQNHDRAGSSPRVRGTVHHRRRRDEGGRFIPACAGNSRARTSSSVPRSVHPRVCGEQSLIHSAISSLYGSSPRVRGTDRSSVGGGSRRRFIPACAGNSDNRRAALTPVPVHPRVCGEQPPCSIGDTATAGSSPRVRGTVVGIELAISLWRFIPACAGNRTRSPPLACRRPVHPRVCGEQRADETMGAIRTGSSPRVRGTVPFCRPGKTRRRFIPACAGNSYVSGTILRLPSVHPRVCGEQFASRLHCTRPPGSSPRVRGTVCRERRDLRLCRFIPACAGNSSSAGKSQEGFSVHPRVCGEQVSVNCEPAV